MKDDEDENYVWDVEYVHGRIDAYDAEARPPATHVSTSAPSESEIRRSETQMSSSAPSEPKSSPSKHVVSNVNYKASDQQLGLVGKAFTTDGRWQKLFFVAEVKYLEDYDEICCCCVCLPSPGILMV